MTSYAAEYGEDVEELAEIRPQVKQELMLASPADFTLGGGSAGSGKLLANSTLIPTPSGYVRMGDIVAGQEVFDETGKICRVVTAHDIELNPVLYRMTFDDGSSVVCCEDHQWFTYTDAERNYLRSGTDEVRAKRRATRKFRGVTDTPNYHKTNGTLIGCNLRTGQCGGVRTTKEILATLRVGAAKRTNHSIPVTEALELPDQHYDLDPYLLGAWLGDGSKRSDHFTSVDGIARAFVDHGFTVTQQTHKEFGVLGLTKVLRALGVKYNCNVLQYKQVPVAYLRGSKRQRLALLQGLMDTEGTVNRDKGNATFCNTNKWIVDAVVDLVAGLGWKPSVSSGIGKLNGEAKKQFWRVDFKPTETVFRLERKTNLLKLTSHRATNRMRYIVDITPVPSEPGRCITVDSPSSLYLAGREMIVTHNTWTILMHPLRYLLTLRNFRGVIFRRTTPQIRAPGGIWDAAVELYSQFPELVLRSTSLTVTNPELNSSIAFSHLEQAKDVLNWQGTELAFIGFDELTHFEASQLWYMMSRNRSMCGLRPYIFGTCNPESNHWLLDFVDWYLYPLGHPLAGTPDPEKSGKLRYFIRLAGDLHWSDNVHELVQRTGCDIDDVKTFTFIPSSIYDNGKLLEKDKGYLANLKALPYVDRMRLLEANWYVKLSAGMFFKDEWFPRIAKTAVPRGCLFVRYWDRAGTEPSTTNPNPDWTAGVRIGRHAGTGEFFVTDVVRVRVSPAKVVDLIIATALADGFGVPIALEQDPGQAGKSEAATIADTLINMGYTVHVVVASKDKATRAKPASVEAENGRIKVVSAAWTNAYLEELENFDGTGKGSKDDQVDGTSGGVNLLMTLVPVAVFHAAFGGARSYTKQLGNNHG